MCGRYALTPSRAAIVDEFNLGVETDLQYTLSVFGRYNIAPQVVAGGVCAEK